MVREGQADMPAMLRIDTLKFARSLADAGMDRRQAEALVQGLSDADTSDFATKADIGEVKAEVAGLRADMAELRSELKGEIASVRVELKSEIGDLRAELSDLRAELRGGLAAARSETFRFMYLQVIAIVGLTVTLVKLLP
jgi:ribosomal protein L29